MDTAQWPLHQERIMKSMEEMKSSSNTCSIIKTSTSSRGLETRKGGGGISTSTRGGRGVVVQKEDGGLKGCPRCNSTNTKFCYYNNYSLTQPRYFCKTCKRYWTEGGTLRNIPVGGASRKNKRSATSSSASASVAVGGNMNNIYNNMNPCNSSTTTSSITTSSKKNDNNILLHLHEEEAPHPQDLNLGGFTRQDFKTISELIQVPNFDTRKELSALEMITGINNSSSSRSFFPLMPINATSHPAPGEVYSSNGCFSQLLLPLPDYNNNNKQSLSFSLEDGGFGNGHGGYNTTMQETNNGGRLLQFPFEDLKQTPASTDNGGAGAGAGDSNGYWNGVIGGGGGSW